MSLARLAMTLVDRSIGDAIYLGAMRAFSGHGSKRCPQCWRVRPLDHFLGGRGARRVVSQCARCRARYRGWDALTNAQRLARVRDKRTIPGAKQPGTHPGSRYAKQAQGERRVLFVRRSLNRKTGPIPVSTTDEGSCPSSCPLRGAGCYAAYGHPGGRWREVPRRGMSWADFCAAVASLPEGQLWRHNEAGDLPGDGRAISGADGLDHAALAALVDANRGRRGFTFTHRPLSTAADRLAVRRANARGPRVGRRDGASRRLPALRALRGVGMNGPDLDRDGATPMTPKVTMVEYGMRGDPPEEELTWWQVRINGASLVELKHHDDALRLVPRLQEWLERWWPAAGERLEVFAARRAEVERLRAQLGDVVRDSRRDVDQARAAWEEAARERDRLRARCTELEGERDEARRRLDLLGVAIRAEEVAKVSVPLEAPVDPRVRGSWCAATGTATVSVDGHVVAEFQGPGAHLRGVLSLTTLTSVLARRDEEKRSR